MAVNFYSPSRDRSLAVLVCFACLHFFLQTSSTAVNCATDISIDNNAYETINKYLKEKLHKNPKLSLEELMKSAYEWLNSDRKRDHIRSVFALRKHGNPPSDKALEIALKQFTGLRKNLKQLKCDSESQALREASNDLVDGGDSDELELVKKIILHYDLSHALACQREYPKTFNRRIKTLDKTNKKRVEVVLAGAIRSYLSNNDEGTSYLAMGQTKAKKAVDDLLAQLEDKTIRTRLYLKFVIGVEGTRYSTRSDAYLIYEGMKSLIGSVYGQDPMSVHVRTVSQGKIHMTKEVAMELFKRFLLEPCNSFVEHLSADLFVPARYDAVRLLRQEAQVLQLSDASLSQFYLSWAEFCLCYTFLNDRDYRLQMAQKIGEIAQQEASASTTRG